MEVYMKILKNKLTVFLSVLLSAAIFLTANIPVLALEYSDGHHNFIYEVVDGGAEITGYSYLGGATFRIPEEIEGWPVTAIGDNVFAGSDEMFNGDRIPDTVKKIGSMAFFDCKNLMYYKKIPPTVEHIGDYAFGYMRDENGEITKIEDFKIYGYYGTEAARYANRNGFIFDGVPIPPPAEPKVRVAGGRDYVVGLKQNGTVLLAGEMPSHVDEEVVKAEIAQWRNIIEIIAYYDRIIALKDDGTVVATGYGYNWQRDFSKWADIIQIVQTHEAVVGLKSDGTVEITGSDRLNFFDTVKSWTDIVQIKTSDSAVVGLKSNGTVVSTSIQWDWISQAKVEDWTDITSIEVTHNDVVIGYKSDGTFVYSDTVRDEGGPSSGEYGLRDAVKVFPAAESTFSLDSSGFVWIVFYESLASDYPLAEEILYAFSDLYLDVAPLDEAGLVGVKSNGDVMVEGFIGDALKEAVAELNLFEENPGDVNTDGEVTAADLVILAKHLIDKEKIADDRLYIADVNRDGEVNVKDLMLVVLFVSGKIPVLG
jgi:hypothetical protein